MRVHSFYLFKYLSYAALLSIAVYVAGWVAGTWPGDAELFLSCLTLFCSLCWAMDKIVWAPQREKENIGLIAAHHARVQEQMTVDVEPTGDELERLHDMEDELDESIAPPLWISNTAGCFWVLFVVWSVRSFLWEPFYVPSGSMLPTLRTGDAIAVNKWTEGIRIPGTKIWLTGPYIKPGDPIVFRYPEDPALHFIKRVVAVENDTITYNNKTVSVNGKQYAQAPVIGGNVDAVPFRNESTHTLFFSETNQSSLSYAIQIESSTDSTFEPTPRMVALWPNACVHDGSTVTCKVPARHAFVLGDNRDNSVDSRFWGFVPYDSVKGKATRYLFNAKAIGTSTPLTAIR